MTQTSHNSPSQPDWNALNHPFWRFSLSFYEKPQVAPLCLNLQDQQGLDVNCLLFACWLGHQGRRLVRDHPAWIRIGHWQRDIVQPLRELRRAQPKLTEAEKRLRRMLQETELKAEQCEQWWLFSASEQLSVLQSQEPVELTWSNLLDVAQDASQPDNSLLERLRELMALNHPEMDESVLSQLSP